MSASPAVHRRPSPSVLCVVVVFSASSGSRYETVETDLFVPSSLLVVKTVLWGARKNRPPSVSSATNGHFRRALIDALMCALMSGTPCLNEVSFWHSHFFFYILLPYSNINVSNGAMHAVVLAFFLLLLNEIAHRCELFWLELFQRRSVTLQHVLARPLKRHCLALSLRKFLLRPFAVGQQRNSYKLPTSLEQLSA